MSTYTEILFEFSSSLHLFHINSEKHVLLTLQVHAQQQKDSFLFDFVIKVKMTKGQHCCWSRAPNARILITHCLNFD